MPRPDWTKISEAFLDDSSLETQFTCLEEDKPDRESGSRWHTYTGDVHQELRGPQQGMWAWSMTMALPGPRLPFPRNGREAKGGMRAVLSSAMCG
jgi:hypothetical protein